MFIHRKQFSPGVTDVELFLHETILVHISENMSFLNVSLDSVQITNFNIL